jgi:hypothetical protein
MAVSTLGLVSFALLFLSGFALLACVHKERYYIGWLSLLDLVDPGVALERFEKKMARFGAWMAILSGVSLMAAVLCVGLILSEFSKLHAPEAEETKWTAEDWPLEQAEKRYVEERRRLFEALLLKYQSKIDTELRELAAGSDFGVLLELNRERSRAMALEREARNDERRLWEGLTGDEAHLFPILGPEAPEAVIELRRSWTLALGKIYEATGGEFLQALERLEAAGGQEGIAGMRANFAAVQLMCGPPRGAFEMSTDALRTSKL